MTPSWLGQPRYARRPAPPGAASNDRHDPPVSLAGQRRLASLGCSWEGQSRDRRPRRSGHSRRVRVRYQAEAPEPLGTAWPK
jgi:hypothetical protein